MSYPLPPATAPEAGRRPPGHLWFLLLPLLSFGMLTFVLFLWAAQRTRPPRSAALPGALPTCPQASVGPPRLVLLGAAAVTAVLALSGGSLLRFVLCVAGVLLALRWRDRLFPPEVSPTIAMLNAQSVPPAVARAHARRALREQYRQLAQQDPAVAREIGVGLVHRQRDYDDGGLVDLNRVPAGVLVETAGLTPEQAAQLVQVREQRHGLASLDEVVVYTDLPHEAVERLREYAVLVPL